MKNLYFFLLTVGVNLKFKKEKYIFDSTFSLCVREMVYYCVTISRYLIFFVCYFLVIIFFNYIL